MANSHLCSIDGCGNLVKARGWCGKHWLRWWKHGDPTHDVRQAKLELSGQRFGRLVALSDTGHRKQGQSIWLCKCDCGNDAEVQAGNLRSGNTNSCGCLQNDMRATASVRHGEARSSGHSIEWTTWQSMVARCKYPSATSYPWYGAKGIKVCERWSGDDGFVNFLEDMGRRPGDGWSIDRVDPNGDYEPSNCRWLTLSENCSRARNSIKQSEERRGLIA